MIGKKFGRLTIIEQLSERHPTNKGIYWLCICECGNTKKVITSSLRCGNTKSCGCLEIERNMELSSRITIRNTKEKGVAAFNTLYYNYKYRAAKLGVGFYLSEDAFRVLTSSLCAYCGVAPSQTVRPNDRKKRMNGNYLYNGIDRIDNTLGYTSENSITCCGICNKAKRDLSPAEFETWINRLVEFRRKKI